MNRVSFSINNKGEIEIINDKRMIINSVDSGYSKDCELYSSPIICETKMNNLKLTKYIPSKTPVEVYEYTSKLSDFSEISNKNYIKENKAKIENPNIQNNQIIQNQAKNKTKTKSRGYSESKKSTIPVKLRTFSLNLGNSKCNNNTTQEILENTQFSNIQNLESIGFKSSTTIPAEYGNAIMFLPTPNITNLNKNSENLENSKNLENLKRKTNSTLKVPFSNFEAPKQNETTKKSNVYKSNTLVSRSKKHKNDQKYKSKSLHNKSILNDFNIEEYIGEHIIKEISLSKDNISTDIDSLENHSSSNFNQIFQNKPQNQTQTHVSIPFPISNSKHTNLNLNLNLNLNKLNLKKKNLFFDQNKKQSSIFSCFRGIIKSFKCFHK